MQVYVTQTTFLHHCVTYKFGGTVQEQADISFIRAGSVAACTGPPGRQQSRDNVHSEYLTTLVFSLCKRAQALIPSA